MIKYSKKPVYNFMDDIDYKDGGYKGRKCISGIAGDCRKKIFGSRQDQVCSSCKKSNGHIQDIKVHGEITEWKN